LTAVSETGAEAAALPVEGAAQWPPVRREVSRLRGHGSYERECDTPGVRLRRPVAVATGGRECSAIAAPPGLGTFASRCGLKRVRTAPCRNRQARAVPNRTEARDVYESHDQRRCAWGASGSTPNLRDMSEFRHIQ